MLAVVAACGVATPATTAGPSVATSAAPTTSSTATAIDQIRTRGTLVVAIRVEAPPANRAMGDPAHAQKRALEMAVATLVANAVFGASVKVQFQSQGGDRVAALAQGADLAMVTDSSAARDRAAVTPPYAANAVVIAVRDGGPIARVEDLAAKSVGVAQDELVTRDLAQTFFQSKNVSATLDTYVGVNGGAMALESDKAVAFVGDGIGVAFVAADRKLKIIAEVTPRPYVIAIRQNAPDLATAIATALQAALQSGAVKDAAAKAGFPYTAP